MKRVIYSIYIDVPAKEHYGKSKHRKDTIELRKEESYYSYTAGNSDSPKIIDLRGKEVPDNIRKWRPR